MSEREKENGRKNLVRCRWETKKQNEPKKVENENRRESYKIFYIFFLDLVNEIKNLVGFIFFFLGELFCCCERMSETEYVWERDRQIVFLEFVIVYNERMTERGIFFVFCWSWNDKTKWKKHAKKQIKNRNVTFISWGKKTERETEWDRARERERRWLCVFVVAVGCYCYCCCCYCCSVSWLFLLLLG